MRRRSAPEPELAFRQQAADPHAERVAKLSAYFETCSSGDEYDREAITHVMACTSHFPGAFLADGVAQASR